MCLDLKKIVHFSSHTLKHSSRTCINGFTTVLNMKVLINRGKRLEYKTFTTKKGASYVTLTAGQTAHYLALLKTLMPMPLFHIMHFFYFLPPK